MPQEIERKFRVRDDGWRSEARDATTLRQGFLVTEAERTVRVRVTDTAAMLTIKGRSEGARRAEYEYALPREEAEEILDTLCLRPLIEKTRYRVDHGGYTWEVDEFFGDNAGLVVAELEVDDEQDEFARPSWLGEEVTTDPRYYNARLIHEPYCEWPEVARGGHG